MPAQVTTQMYSAVELPIMSKVVIQEAEVRTPWGVFIANSRNANTCQTDFVEAASESRCAAISRQGKILTCGEGKNEKLWPCESRHRRPTGPPTPEAFSVPRVTAFWESP